MEQQQPHILIAPTNHPLISTELLDNSFIPIVRPTHFFPKWINGRIHYGNNTGIRVPASDGGRKGYGYSWWTWTPKHNGEELDTYYAGGWGGQRIFVIPDLDTVVVMTCGNYTSKSYTFTIMEDYILAAME